MTVCSPEGQYETPAMEQAVPVGCDRHNRGTFQQAALFSNGGSKLNCTFHFLKG